jgi:hypothetical protein
MINLSHKGEFTATECERSRFDKVSFLSNYIDALCLGLVRYWVSAKGYIRFLCKCFHLRQHSLHGSSGRGKQQHIISIAHSTHEESCHMGPKSKITKALKKWVSIDCPEDGGQNSSLPGTIGDGHLTGLDTPP